MKFKLRYYVFFVFTAIFSAAVGVWLNISFGIVPGERLGYCSEGAPGALPALTFVVSALKLPCAVFLSGFTIYALPTCLFSALYSGWVLGDFAYGCLISPYSSAITALGCTASAAALLLMAFISYSAAVNRSSLRSAAPSVGSLLKNPDVRRFFSFFSIYAAVFVALFCVIYCYGCFFPR